MEEPVFVLKLYQKGKKTNSLFDRKKLFSENEYFCSKYFRRFENAVAYVSDGNLFKDYLPEEKIGTLGKPEIYYGSKDADGNADDFELRYENDIVVYIGQIIFEEDI